MGVADDEEDGVEDWQGWVSEGNVKRAVMRNHQRRDQEHAGTRCRNDDRSWREYESEDREVDTQWASHSMNPDSMPGEVVLMKGSAMAGDNKVIQQVPERYDS